MLEEILKYVRKELEGLEKPLVVLVGPTAVGKTKVSIGLAKAIGAEIVSGDATQFYKGMDIATDKIKEEEMQGVVHHMIDIIEPDEIYTVRDYKEDVEKVIDEILGRSKIPLLTGGSMLYIEAVAKQYDFETGGRSESKYDVIWVGLTRPREDLYKDIDERVVREFGDGLLEEAQAMLDKGLDPKLPSMQALGYKQTVPHLLGEYSYEEMVRLLQRDTRHFCKRQLTWWRANEEIVWFDLAKEAVVSSPDA